MLAQRNPYVVFRLTQPVQAAKSDAVVRAEAAAAGARSASLLMSARDEPRLFLPQKYTVGALRAEHSRFNLLVACSRRRTSASRTKRTNCLTGRAIDSRYRFHGFSIIWMATKTSSPSDPARCQIPCAAHACARRSANRVTSFRRERGVVWRARRLTARAVVSFY